MTRMTRGLTAVAMAAGAFIATLPGTALAGDCTGNVVGVRPISQYNHAAGNGFLAVRAGPGTNYAQIGEVYLGDEISVWERQGNWIYISCMNGRCLNPLWGDTGPQGWAYGKYLTYGGVCP